MRTYLVLTALIASLALGLFGLMAQADRGPLATTVNRDLYLKQLENDDAVPRQIESERLHRQNKATGNMLMQVALCLFLGAGATQVAFSRRASRLRADTQAIAQPKPIGSPEL